MPAALLSKKQILERLMTVFRDKGYDGASLAELSSITGLGKSSLYHYFPRGKADMAERVLAHMEASLELALFAPLRDESSPQTKLDAMLDALTEFYGGGRLACLLERLCASAERSQFRRPLARVFRTWIDAVESLAREAGIPKLVARSRAEDLVIRIEGALVVAAGTGDIGAFQRTIESLRHSTLATSHAKPRRRSAAS